MLFFLELLFTLYLHLMYLKINFVFCQFLRTKYARQSHIMCIHLKSNHTSSFNKSNCACFAGFLFTLHTHTLPSLFTFHIFQEGEKKGIYTSKICKPPVILEWNDRKTSHCLYATWGHFPIDLNEISLNPYIRHTVY